MHVKLVPMQLFKKLNDRRFLLVDSGLTLCGFLRDKIALSLPRLLEQRGKAGKSGSSEPTEAITAFVAIFERKKFRHALRDKSIKCSLDFLVTF